MSHLNKQPSPSKGWLPVLSCELCTNRKVKCDKGAPCTNCIRARVECKPVHRKRLPRGRHAPKNSPDRGLRDRVARLEALLQTAGRTNGEQKQQQVVAEGDPTGKEPAQPLGRIMGRPFWNSLVEEVQGLRDFLNDDSEDDPDETDTNPLLQEPKLGYSIIGFSHAPPPSSPPKTSPLYTLPDKIACEIYLEQVDPLVKVFHRPSISRLMIDRGNYLDYPKHAPEVEALRATIRYAAVGSMTAAQLSAAFTDLPRNLVVAEYRAASESAISNAGLLVSNDVLCLQAFVVYMFITRSNNSTRAVWLLFTMAVRMAQGLGINRVQARPEETIFEREARRRLWCAICLLDLQGSFEAPLSEPLTDPDAPQTDPPRNIDDADIGLLTTEVVRDSEGITDTSLLLLYHEGQAVVKRLNFRMSSSEIMRWDVRQQLISNFATKVNKLILNSHLRTNPYTWRIRATATYLLALANLSAVRPIQPRFFEPPPSPPSSAELLSLAGSVLASANDLRNNPLGAGMCWFDIVHWQCLAIALRECYVCPDVGLVQRFWPELETAFRQYAEIVADSKHGKLWRPMKRLMQRARHRVRALANEDSKALSARLDSIDALLELSAETDMTLDLDFPMTATSQDEELLNAFMSAEPSWSSWDCNALGFGLGSGLVQDPC